MSDMSFRFFYTPAPTVKSAVTMPARPRPDRRDGKVYVHSPSIVLAVNGALATGRPLLVRGKPGSGKSSLAASVARDLGWRYYEDVISSRTQARDLLWRYDNVRRLNDAQAGQDLLPAVAYVEPGALWWAMSPETARRRGAREEENVVTKSDPGAGEGPSAVVLLDEIDKADPDVPNDLLVPLGSLQFRVTEIDRLIEATSTPLVVLTTNDERDLPPAFVRRCVVLELAAPDRGRLLEIATAHFGPDGSGLYERLAEHLLALQSQAARDQRAPSTAEYLDTIRACRDLAIGPAHARWDELLALTLDKSLD